MSHPILHFELNELRKRSRQFLMHNQPASEFACFLNAFFGTEYVNPGVMIAVAELFASLPAAGGDGE